LTKISHNIPWGLRFIARSKKLQEKPLEIQLNLQDVFGYMPLPKECWSRYMKFSKSGKSGTTRSFTHLQTRDKLWSTIRHVLFFKRCFRKSNS
jgi:hypothetical protein